MFYHHAKVVTAGQIKYLVGQEKRKRPYQTKGQLTPLVLTPCLSSTLWHLAHTFHENCIKNENKSDGKKIKSRKTAAIEATACVCSCWHHVKLIVQPCELSSHIIINCILPVLMWNYKCSIIMILKQPELNSSSTKVSIQSWKCSERSSITIKKSWQRKKAVSKNYR